MKRFLFVCIAYLLFLSIPIQAEISTIQYKIYGSKEISNLEVKNHIYKTLKVLCEGVDEEHYKDIVIENLEELNYKNKCDIKFKNNTIYIVVEEGDGTYIKGSYPQKNICYEEVKPESIVFQWFKGRK